MLALGLIREVKYNWDRCLKSSVHFRARTVNVDPQIVFKRFKRNKLKIVEGIVFWQDEMLRIDYLIRFCFFFYWAFA